MLTPLGHGIPNLVNPSQTLTIVDLSRAGAGVGKDADGRAIFVPFTMPGDQIEVEILKSDKRYAHARLTKLLRPSPERVGAPCAVFTRCGGCQWQHVPYARQWTTKHSGVLHALRRVGVATDGIPFDEFPAESPYGYRNRIQLRGKGNDLGFYESGSKRRVSIRRCEIARPEINAALPRIQAEAVERMPAGKEFKVELEVTEAGDVRAHWNAPHAAGGFRQINDDQNLKLRQAVATYLPSTRPGGVLLDLYGGAGNLSLGIQQHYAAVHCVDTGTPRERPDGALDTFTFHRSPVSLWLARPDVPQALHAILDPPREGLGAEFQQIAEGIERRGIERFVHVGCDVDAWARDMTRWVKRGWELERLAAVDLFPQTPHVEAVGVLVKAIDRS